MKYGYTVNGWRVTEKQFHDTIKLHIENDHNYNNFDTVEEYLDTHKIGHLTVKIGDYIFKKERL